MEEMLLAADVRDGETIKISAAKDGLSFNGKKAPAVDEEDEAETV